MKPCGAPGKTPIVAADRGLEKLDQFASGRHANQRLTIEAPCEQSTQTFAEMASFVKAAQLSERVSTNQIFDNDRQVELQRAHIALRKV
jgi:hypothetical protein